MDIRRKQHEHYNLHAINDADGEVVFEGNKMTNKIDWFNRIGIVLTVTSILGFTIIVVVDIVKWLMRIIK